MREILTVNIGNLSNQAISGFFNHEIAKIGSESYENSVFFDLQSNNIALPRLVTINFPASSSPTLSKEDINKLQTNIQNLSVNEVQIINQSFKNTNFDFRASYQHSLSAKSVVDLVSLTLKESEKRQYCSLAEISLEQSLDSIRNQLEKCDKLEHLVFTYDSYNCFGGFSSRVLHEITDQLLNKRSLISVPIFFNEENNKRISDLYEINNAISLVNNEELSRLTIPLRLSTFENLNLIGAVYGTMFSPFTSSDNDRYSRLSLSSFFPSTLRNLVNCHFYDLSSLASGGITFYRAEPSMEKCITENYDLSIEHEVLIKRGDLPVSLNSSQSMFEISVENNKAQDNTAVRLFQNEAITGKMIYGNYSKLKNNSKLFKYTYGQEEEDRDEIIEKGKTLFEKYNLKELEKSDEDEIW